MSLRRSLALCLAASMGLCAQQPSAESDLVVGQDICLSINNTDAGASSAIGSRATYPIGPFLQPPVAERPAILAFGVADDKGALSTVAEQAGKIVVVAFWDHGCKGALKELQEMRQFQLTQARPDLVLWPVHSNTWPAVNSFLRRKAEFFSGVKVYRMSIGEHGSHTLGFEIHSLPTVLVLDRSGRIAARWEGYHPDRLATVLNRVYSEPPTGSGK